MGFIADAVESAFDLVGDLVEGVVDVAIDVVTLQWDKIYDDIMETISKVVTDVLNITHDIGNLKNAHHIRILNKRGKYECDLYYHPSVPELGWPQVRLLMNMAFLKNYEVMAALK